MQEFKRHLQEAINLNTERMPLYSELTNGDSLRYSKKLISDERMALWWAWIFDRVGDKYQAKGVPFMKAEFVEMSLVPEFSNCYPSNINYQIALQKVEIKNFSSQLKNEIKKDKFESIIQTCNEFLDDLHKQPHVYCMLRHVIESLRRIAYLIPVHQKKCDQLNLSFPIIYSVILLKIHRLVLGRSKELDEAIAPIQIAGVPFLFQDLPPIDLGLEWEN